MKSQASARKQPVENLAGAVLDLGQLDFQRLMIEMFRRPAMHQLGQHFELRFGIRQAAFGVAGVDAQPVIHGAIERGGIAQKLGVGALQVAHGFDDVDAGGRVQHLDRRCRRL